MKTFNFNIANDETGRYGRQPFIVLINIPESGRDDTFDIDVCALRTTGEPKLLFSTLKDVPRNGEAINKAVARGFGCEVAP